MHFRQLATFQIDLTAGGSAGYRPHNGLHADHDDAENEEGGAGKPDQACGLDGNAEQAEMVEGERAEHLPRDEEGEEGCRAEFRNQQNGERE